MDGERAPHLVVDAQWDTCDHVLSMTTDGVNSSQYLSIPPICHPGASFSFQGD